MNALLVDCPAAAAVLSSGGTATTQQSMLSIYTDHSCKACTNHINEESAGTYTLDCPGS